MPSKLLVMRASDITLPILEFKHPICDGEQDARMQAHPLLDIVRSEERYVSGVLPLGIAPYRRGLSRQVLRFDSAPPKRRRDPTK